MDCYTFGRELVRTKDLDPVYVLAWETGMGKYQLRNWLLAYWCFYHVGTASWICDGDFWERMERAAASKDYPRSAERRHFRGQAALKSVQYLKSRGVDALFKDLLRAGVKASDKINTVRRWYLFGEWISFKVVDMLERLDLCPVEFDVGTAFYEGSPTKGAQLLWDHHNPGLDSGREPGGVCNWAADMILGELGHLDAPPRYERKINVQEVETICCKWKSYMNGHYHVGEDIEACRRALAWGSTHRSHFSQKMYQAGKRGELW